MKKKAHAMTTKPVGSFWRDDSGQGMTEYVIVSSMIILFITTLLFRDPTFGWAWKTDPMVDPTGGEVLSRQSVAYFMKWMMVNVAIPIP